MEEPKTPPVQDPPNPETPKDPPAGDPKPPAGDPPKPPVPDKYELTLSDASPLDAQHTETIAALARELGVSNEQAQKLLATNEATVVGILEKQNQLIADEIAGWAEVTKKDKDMGGANWPVTEASVKRAMDRFVPEGSALRKLLVDTGYGNHPEFVRLMRDIGKQLAEDKPPNAPSGDKPKKKAQEDIMFPKTAVQN